MSGELLGKVAIITGGSSGIGKGSTKRFVEEGAKVVIADVNEEAGEELARELGEDCAFCKADVSLPDDVENLVTSPLALPRRLSDSLSYASAIRRAS